MKSSDIFQVILFVGALVTLAPILGVFLARIFKGDKTFLTSLLGWLEKLIYKIAGLNPNAEMNWKEYAKSLLVFNLIGFAFLFLLQISQKVLPLNPQGFENLSWHLAFSTAVSFVTNTNWQSYGGEATMSYLTQMLGLTVQNFVSAATGISVFLVLVRGLIQKQNSKLGNFWVDLTRSTVYILLPLSVVLAIVLTHEGVIQNFDPYQKLQTLEGQEQIIPEGPAASQIAIKQLGTNGGGFFNTNSAHPFENPTPFSNFLQMLSILLIPAALTFTFGQMVGSMRQGLTLFLVMFSVWMAGLTISISSEYQTNPVLGVSGVMEGKETRFGVINSVIWSTATTVASNGSVNAMHSSLSPLSGGVQKKSAD